MKVHQRLKPKPNSIVNIEHKDSVLIFKGRILLKEIYFQLNLCSEDEMNNLTVMPSNNLLKAIPLFNEMGLNAASELLYFIPEGIKIFGDDNMYSHQSREKLAVLYLILKFEVQKEYQLSAILRDELLSIMRMSELVDWISNLQSEKDMRRILEKERPVKRSIIVKAPEIKSNERLLRASELAEELGISTKTINRHPTQFKVHIMGKRKFYYLSECEAYRKRI